MPRPQRVVNDLRRRRELGLEVMARIALDRLRERLHPGLDGAALNILISAAKLAMETTGMSNRATRKRFML
jgi:hypothetical protein